MTYYYTIPMAAFLGISVLVTILREHIGTSSNALSPDTSLWILVAICIGQACASFWVQLNKSKVSILERAGYFGDDEFKAMFSGTEEGLREFGRVIERHTTDDGTTDAR